MITTSVMPMGSPVEIEGQMVTAYDANHMAGSIMLYFNKTRTLRTGDYRYHPNMPLPKRTDVESLLVDDTFNNIDIDLPSINVTVKLVHEWLQHHLQHRPVIYIGYFHFGTCELLDSLFQAHGYKFKFRREKISEEEQNICMMLYPHMWDTDSRIVIIPAHKRYHLSTTSNIKPILLPSCQWWRNQIKTDIILERDGEFRLCFSNHSSKKENMALFARLAPKTYSHIH
jgi:hypothetical protein